MRPGMGIVAVVRRAGLGLVYPPLRVGDELLAVGRVVANGSEGVERQREEVGRRLAELTTESDEDEEIQDFPIGRLPEYFRWCGIASAGAELRISGPKAPVSA